MNNTRKKQLKLSYVFWLSALLGAVFFVGIYGLRVLDFTNTGWLFYGDNDLRQHYIAWCNYRKDPWHFPIGLIDSLSYPYSMSVIYTDSIPLFAVIFKLFAGYLPVQFQYFGLFGLLSFMLMGGLSAVLIDRFIADPLVDIIGSAFFITSFTVIQRMYYHTALAAQWIIILAFVIWVYDEKISGFWKKIAIWAFMGFLIVSIHSYFLPMVGFILLALMLQQYCLSDIKEKDFISILKRLKLPLAEVLAFSLAGILNLWILGGFYGGTSAFGPGLGTFSSNLNTFINPLEYGRVLHPLPLYFDFQYEGYGYLGAGILFLYIVVLTGMIFRMVRGVKEKSFHGNKIYGRLSLMVFLLSLVFSVFPIITLSNKEIIHIPYPGFVERLLGIFRSNGRLIWVAVYLLMLAAIAFTAYTFRQNRAVSIAIIAVALLIQVYDLSNTYMEKYRYFSADYPVETLWDDPDLSVLTEKGNKNEFVFLYTDNDITLQSAYYGYLHNFRQNNYYFARDIDDKVRDTIRSYQAELDAGNLRDNVIYIVTEEMYRQNPDYYENLDATKVLKHGHLYFTN